MRTSSALRIAQGAFLAAVALLGAFSLPAFPDPLRARLDHALADLGPPAPLLDRAAPGTSLNALDGSLAAPAVTDASWRQLVADLGRAADASWGTPDWSRLAGRGTRAAAGPIPIGLVDVAASRIRADAVETGALFANGDRLAATPEAFEPVHVFAAAPLAGYTYRGEQTSFFLDPSRVLVDGGLPTTVEIDFDDGRGYRAASFGEVLRVHWVTTGEKQLRFRATTSGGAVLHARSLFAVRALGTPAPHDTLNITASVPFGGQFGTGQAYVYRSDQNATLTNPIVVFEGFDLDDTYFWEELYALLNEQNLVETLRSLGYDLVVLDFTEATVPIERNAFVAAELLQQVDALTGDASSFVLGASMGGLVGRYALSWMEQQGIPHTARTYLTFDTPHDGASIPLGIQYWLDFFSDLSDAAAFLLSRLDTDAARQMLIYHHTSPPGPTGVADPMRATFLDNLAGVGGWPSIPRLVSVANGSAAGVNQGFAAGDQVIQYEYRSFLVDVDGDVYAVPDGGSQLILDARVDIILLPEDVLQVTVSGTLPYDSAPGGRRDSMAQMDATEAPYGDIIALHDDHCFVPTVSAFALGESDLFFDVDGTGDLAALTPFDAVYFPTAPANQDHVFISAETAAWVIAEVQAAATGVRAPFPPGVTWLTLAPNAPNPFRQSTSIRFSLGTMSPVTIRVYDVNGRHIATPLRRVTLGEGPHGVPWNAAGLANGVYYYRVTAGAAEASGRVTLTR